MKMLYGPLVCAMEQPPNTLLHLAPTTESGLVWPQRSVKAAVVGPERLYVAVELVNGSPRSVPELNGGNVLMCSPVSVRSQGLVAQAPELYPRMGLAQT